MALATILAVSTPALAHVGHGDEFNATGDVQRVEINAETDGALGIQVVPIEPAVDGSAAVLIPVTSLVEADGSTYTFVEYEGFYEPVPVTTGASQGDLIEITEGLSVGEKLVTQGGLTLYAQSLRAQPATAAQEEAPAEPVDSSVISVPTPTKGFPLLPVAGVGTVALLLVGGALAVANNGKRR
ncbi:cobalt transporter [[Limnothrix rosea] IAM M-220]|uniref:cobalt transporter n=1 Tax=[Limnothrix rosea] IAM M-220 TaxID=454133 RepID=UPI001CEC43EF|nr:cobalt transporter [[Limnothrix rosea] IAM M-220]